MRRGVPAYQVVPTTHPPRPSGGAKTRAHPPPWLRPAYCFASVIVWTTENKNVTISDRFICFILTVKQWAALVACVLRATTKKRSPFFEENKCIRWSSLRPRNDLAPLMPWRLHLMTCLTTLVTWKWPGCFDVLAPPLPRPFFANWAATATHCNWKWWKLSTSKWKHSTCFMFHFWTAFCLTTPFSHFSWQFGFRLLHSFAGFVQCRQACSPILRAKKSQFVGQC